MRGETRIIAINDAWRLAPSADVLYAADAKWWKHWQGVPSFQGEKWTQDLSGGLAVARKFGLRLVKCLVHFPPSAGRGEHAVGLSRDPGYVISGYNSTFQAMGMAAHWGVERIIALGLDCQGSKDRPHWFGRHPPELNQHLHLKNWIEAFDAAAPGFEAAGIDVINASRDTALTCFRRGDIEAIFA